MLGVPMSGDYRKQWRLDILCAVVIWAVAALNWFRPHLVSNEQVYLLPPMQWWDAGVLATDWTWGGDLWRSSALLFAWLAAPLWGISDSPQVVALVGRGLVWGLLALAIVRLGRALRVRPRWIVFGVGAWLMTGQSIAAGEWLFLGFERKPFAHAAALLSLAAIVRDRPLAAGAWSGVAVAFHVLVGGWFGLASAAAVLVKWRRWGARGVGKFALTAGLVATPFAAMAVTYLLSTDGTAPAASPDRVTWLVTAFRNPHHTLPSHFLNATKVLWFAALSLSAAWAAWRLLARQQALAVIAALAVAVVAFAAGWLAGKMQWLGLLQYYPFRLGDVLVPLLAWVLVPSAIWRTWRSPSLANEPPREATSHWSHRLASGAAMACLLATAAVHLPAGLQRAEDTCKSWPMGRPAVADVGHWARTSTEREATFIAPPCLFAFWVQARRPVVVSYKAMPHGPRAAQWYERLKAVTGGEPIAGTGFEVCAQLTARHRELDVTQLRSLRQRFSARFYLLRGQRPELAKAEIYRDVRFAVYDIDALTNDDGAVATSKE